MTIVFNLLYNLQALNVIEKRSSFFYILVELLDLILAISLTFE